MTRRILTRERLLEIFACYEHLPEAENIEVTILKGHLHVEGRLVEYIQKRLGNPDAFDPNRFQFSQLLTIAHSLCNAEEYDDLWTSIQKLNTLRNRLSHELDQSRFDQALQGLLGFHTSRFFQGHEDEHRNIHSCIVSIYSSLVHLIAETTG